MVRIFKLLDRLILIFMSLCLFLVSIISGISIGLIFSNPSNINIDLVNTQFNQNGTHLYLFIPYSINNVGFYSINNMIFYYNITAFNSTNRFHVITGNYPLGSFPAQTKTISNITINLELGTNLYLDLWEDWEIDLHADMSLSGTYALDLMNFYIFFPLNYTLYGG